MSRRCTLITFPRTRPASEFQLTCSPILNVLTMMESKTIGLVRSNTITIIEPSLEQGFSANHQYQRAGKVPRADQIELARVRPVRRHGRDAACGDPAKKGSGPFRNWWVTKSPTSRSHQCLRTEMRSQRTIGQDQLALILREQIGFSILPSGGAQGAVPALC